MRSQARQNEAFPVILHLHEVLGEALPIGKGFYRVHLVARSFAREILGRHQQLKQLVEYITEFGHDGCKDMARKCPT